MQGHSNRGDAEEEAAPKGHNYRTVFLVLQHWVARNENGNQDGNVE